MHTAAFRPECCLVKLHACELVDNADSSNTQSLDLPVNGICVEIALVAYQRNIVVLKPV